jgi:hypothetical protein
MEDSQDRLEAYCFRCKTKKQMKTPTETRMKNGKMAVTGTCVTCGTKMFKILATPDDRSNPR